MNSDKKEFLTIVADLLDNDMVNQMKQYRQHYDSSTYEHCINVSYISYKICKKLKLDYVSMARAAMLHDLFLYDWRAPRENKKFSELHAFSHPKIALENAKKVTKLNEKEIDIIEKHMWPVTIKLPKYKESYVITFADKYSAIQEGIRYYKKKNSIRRAYIYTYLFSNVVRDIICTI